ncbi:MAG TPA: DUF6531 domain-containing protein, partial [Rhodocyclaceae bacterium]|nr:DUF6531 domain-containing protein [Rhodocyclaceae bacterium]
MNGSPYHFRLPDKSCINLLLLLLAQGTQAYTEPQVIPSFPADFYWTESTYSPGRRFSKAQEACLHIQNTSNNTDCSFVDQNPNGMASGTCHCYRPYMKDWVNVGSVIHWPDCTMHPNTQYSPGVPEAEDGVCVALYYGCRNDSFKHSSVSGTCSRNDDPKGNGQFCPATPAPIVLGTGNKFLIENDVPAAARGSLSLLRTYNSNGTVSAGAFGVGWRASGMQRIHAHFLNGQYYADVHREDGRIYGFQRINGEYVPATDITDRLTRLTDHGATAGWRYTTAASQETEHYDALGRLTSVVDRAGLTRRFSYDPSGRLTAAQDAYGRAITFGYDAQNRIATVTDYAGQEITYSYDTNNNLTSVTYPDGSVRQYHYENATFRNALTGITDERGVRYITYTYDANGRAVGEAMAGEVGGNRLVFGTNQTTLTDPLGSVRSYRFQTI